MKLLTLKCTLSLCFYLAFASEDAAPEHVKNEEVTVDNVIATNSGKVRGRALSCIGCQSYYAFTGIPYAEKPKRFQFSTIRDKCQKMTNKLCVIVARLIFRKQSH